MRGILKPKKKYDLFSLIILVVTLTALSVGAVLFARFIGTDFGTDIRETANEMEIDQGYANLSTDFVKNDVASFSDAYVFWFFIASFIGVILMGLYLEFEPATMILLFIIGAIVVFGACLGASVNQQFTEADAEMNATAQSMPMTQVLMGQVYFTVFILVCLILLVTIMYSRKREGFGQ